MRIGNRFGPAKQHVDAIAKETFTEAIAARDRGQTQEAIDLLVCAVELNPDSDESRAELARLLAGERSLFGKRRTPFDLTKQTLAQWDKPRAEARYREAIGRCVDFAASRGIDGDVLEFGVLGGWTARIFAETLRDVLYACRLWLFDFFVGLPVVSDAVDAASYDIQRGIWRQNMHLPDEMFAESGLSLDGHIRDRLATVISRPRIKMMRGYYADTLTEPLSCKAAIVHLDCDLYSSTKEVLDGLDHHGVLQDGTVLMFDDWNCNRANPRYGQRRAFREFIDSRRDHYDTCPFINYGPNAAVFILHDMRT